MMNRNQNATGRTTDDNHRTTMAGRSWSRGDFPYAVEYNDHFETPKAAYEDILVLIDALFGDASRKNCAPNAKDDGDDDNTTTDNNDDKADGGANHGGKVDQSKHSNSRKRKRQRQRQRQRQRPSQREDVIPYDPYYCNGRAAVLLRDLGFQDVVHECRDFYKDIESGMIPDHDVLVTNPPYSSDHKERCLDFAMEALKTKDRPFFVLLPNYVAAREYYRKLLESNDAVSQSRH